MVDRFFPDRTAGLRQSTAQEIKATSVIAMEIEEASAKIRAKGVGDDEEDYALPIYAERIPVRTVLGAPEPCPRLLDGVERPATLSGYWKAGCSKTHCGMRILRITPAAEIGLGCALPNTLLELPHERRYATKNPRRRRCGL